ncbi:MAG: arginine--tRNA ligase, partial [Parcubacteria group bacterium]|nr:arginine--tRNA ligase [Parcubacteria group bacterium]
MFYLPEYLQSVIVLSAEKAGVSVRSEDVSVEVPADMSHGDYATNIALARAKEAGKNPRELAESVVEHIAEADSEDMISDAFIAGPGFINITLAKSVVLSRLIHAMEEKYGYADEKTRETVVVEYTDPNPFKPFHIGHLMTNIIGESLARLLEAEGDTVVRMNYQGDVGLHIAKALYGMKELSVSPDDILGIGKAYAYGNEKYENDEEAKKTIDALNEQIYARDDEALNALYDEGRTTSLAHFEKLYKRLGTAFDEYVFESETWKKGKDAVEAHVGDVFAESDGAIVYHGEDDGLHTRVFINAKGLPTYEAKDTGLALLKMEKYPDAKTYYTITAVEQAEYFKVVFAALAKMKSETIGRFAHIAHGMMRLSDGKMSSRKGNVITGESLLEDVTERATEKLKENGVGDS